MRSEAPPEAPDVEDVATTAMIDMVRLSSSLVFAVYQPAAAAAVVAAAAVEVVVPASMKYIQRS